MQDLNLIAKLLLIEERGRFSDTKKSNLDELTKDAHEAYRGASDEQRDALDVKYLALQQAVFETLDLMANIFHDKDPLLANQGSIPVFYWFIKHLGLGEHPFVREFLIDLAKDVKDARIVERIDPDMADRQLTLYYTLGRTTNDTGSLTARYEILVERFRKWRMGQTA